MNKLRPSKLLNTHLDWLTYGLSRREPLVIGENNMAYPSILSNDPRRAEWVDRARQRFLAAIGINQIHAITGMDHLGNVQVVSLEQRQLPMVGLDALITNQPGVALATLFADCSPVFLIDPVQQAIGLAHVGWQGSLHNVVGNTVAAMHQTYGSEPANLVVYIGPTICANHYPRPYTGAEWGMIIHLVIQAGVNPVFLHQDTSIYGDIVATSYQILQRLGVFQIEDSGVCTFEHEDQPSARRDDRHLGGPFRANALATIMIRP